MKRIIAITILAVSAFWAGAQNMYDAMTFSQNNYYGTARSLALGNAVTAVGGDLGTIGINPAGSAVPYYSQFTVTPGFSVANVRSSVNNANSGSFDKSRTRMMLPNCGISMSFPTGNNSGLKNFTVAFVVNQTNNYNRSSYATWGNDQNSKCAEFATAANGYDENVLKNYDSFYNSDVPWDVLAAYQAGMFGSYQEGEYGGYVGNTERISPDGSYHYVPGELQQTSNVSRQGVKSDVLINMGFNYNDNLYFGFNIGVPSMNYRYTETFTEAPVQIEQFPISFAEGDTYFTGASYDYQYIASVSGIYAKAGLIWLPTKNIRLGAAVQSPTMMTIKEAWRYGATADFENSKFNGDVVSPEGEYTYGLRTPWSFNVGAAFTFNQSGFISIDYEMADYSIMRFRDIYQESRSFTSSDTYYDVNKTNKNFCGLAHNLRIGGEFRITPAFSIRAGYGIATSPERHWTNSKGKDVTADDYLSDFDEYDKNKLTLVKAEYYGDLTQNISLGVGYSSPGSFFADFAVKATRYPGWNFSPYYDYYGYTSGGDYIEQTAPRISNRMTLIDAVLTLGWRF